MLILYCTTVIIFSVPIELTNFKFIVYMCVHDLAITPPQDITLAKRQTSYHGYSRYTWQYWRI